MEIQVAGDGQLKALQLKGEFRGHDAAAAFRKRAEELIQAGSLWLAVDLSQVAVIDSTGIGALVYVLTSCKRRGGMVKLVRPGDQAGHSLQLVGLLSIFEVFDSLPRALASFRE